MIDTHTVLLKKMENLTTIEIRFDGTKTGIGWVIPILPMLKNSSTTPKTQQKGHKETSKRSLWRDFQLPSAVTLVILGEYIVNFTSIHQVPHTFRGRIADLVRIHK